LFECLGWTLEAAIKKGETSNEKKNDEYGVRVKTKSTRD